MSIFAVVLDDEFKHSPVLRLIYSGPTAESVKRDRRFDPYSAFSEVVRSGFRITRLEPVQLLAEPTNRAVPAHVCELVPL